MRSPQTTPQSRETPQADPHAAHAAHAAHAESAREADGIQPRDHPEPEPPVPNPSEPRETPTLCPLLREIDNCWINQTFVAHATPEGFERLRVESDADLPWLTRKGTERKQPPRAAYVLYLGVFRPAALAEALYSAVERVRTGYAGSATHATEPAPGHVLAGDLERLGGLQSLGSVALDSHGSPLPGTYRVSPLAWAAGRLCALSGSAHAGSSVPEPRQFTDLLERVNSQPPPPAEADEAGLWLTGIRSPVRVDLFEQILRRTIADCGISPSSFESSAALYRGSLPDAGWGGYAAAAFTSPELEHLEILGSLYKKQRGASDSGNGNAGPAALGSYVSRLPGPDPGNGPSIADGSLATRRIPPGKWPGRSGRGEPAYEGEDGQTTGSAGANDPEDTWGRTPDVAIAASRRALLSLPARALSADSENPVSTRFPEARPSIPGGGLHWIGAVSEPDTGPVPEVPRTAGDAAEGAGGVEPGPAALAAWAAGEIAGGAYVERARALAAVGRPEHAFGLRPPVKVAGGSRPAWSPPRELTGWEVTLADHIRPRAGSACETRNDDPEELGAVFSGYLGLPDATGLRRTCEALDSRLLDREEELASANPETGDGGGAPAGPDLSSRHPHEDRLSPLRPVYEDRRERFLESLAEVEGRLDDVRALERDLQARSGGRRELVELASALEGKREELREARAQLDQDGSELERSDAALHQAKVALDAAGDERPNLARRMLAPQAQARWQARVQEARRDFDRRAQRARADNRVYEETEADCRALHQEVSDATRRYRQCAARIELAEDRIRRAYRGAAPSPDGLADLAGGSPATGSAPAEGLKDVDALRERLFHRAVDLHEAFAVINRRYLVDNLMLLAGALEGSLEPPEHPVDSAGAGDPALITDLLRSAALLSPALAVAPGIPAARLLSGAGPGSLGLYLGIHQSSIREEVPDPPGAGRDVLTLAGLHAANAGVLVHSNAGAPATEENLPTNPAAVPDSGAPEAGAPETGPA